MQAIGKKYSAYFCGMTASRENRIARSYSFTFDNEGDKADYHALAERRGTNLANLIKMLLKADLEKNPPKNKPK
jgi:hypothetical protein